MFRSGSTPLAGGVEAAGAPPSLLPVSVVAFMTNLSWSLVAPVIPLYATAQGASPAAVGAVVGLSGLLPLLFGVHGGALVDLYGAPAVMRWSALGYAGAFGLLLTMPAVPVVALAYALMGLGMTGLIVGPQTLVAAWSEPAERARRFGFHSFWVSAGMVSGPLVGGFLVDASGYAAAFLAAAGCAVAISMLTRRLPAAPATLASRTVGLAEVHVLAGGLARRPGVVPILLISFIAIFAYALKQSFYPIYLQRAGFSTTAIGMMLAIHSAGGMIVRPMIGVGVQRLGYSILLLGSILVAAAGIAAVPLLTTFVPLALAASLVGVAQGLTQPLTISLLTSAVETDLRGVALGLRLSAMRLASVSSPLAFGFVATWWGLGSVFYLAGIVLVGTVAVLTRLMRPLAPPTPSPDPAAIPPAR